MPVAWTSRRIVVPIDTHESRPRHEPWSPVSTTDDVAPRAFLFGSCVARDTLEMVDRSTLDIASYIARQSLLSAGSDASAHLPTNLGISEGFKLRMIKNDFSGNLLQSVRQAAESIDVLLWDLADERHGVHRFEDGTIVTRSIDNVQVPAIVELLDATEHLTFGSKTHQSLWTAAAISFTEFLDEVGLLGRTVVLQVPWALHTTEGKPTPWSMGVRARDANRLYEPYYDTLHQLGHNVIKVPAEMVVADPGHRWGLAPFHYTDAVYREVLDQLRIAGVIRLRPQG
nr:DUF6270 domain-containing protein [Ornithinimicrobium sp. HY1793]